MLRLGKRRTQRKKLLEVGRNLRYAGGRHRQAEATGGSREKTKED